MNTQVLVRIFAEELSGLNYILHLKVSHCRLASNQCSEIHLQRENQILHLSPRGAISL